MYVEAIDRDQQLEYLSKHPDLVLVGSIGRALIQGAELPSPETIGFSGVPTARDIDLFSGWRQSPLPAETKVPNPLDNYLDEWVKINKESGALTYPNRSDICVDIPSKYFEPIETKTPNGLTLLAFRPDVQLQIDLMKGTLRPKDVDEVKKLQQFIQDSWHFRDTALYDYFSRFKRQVAIKQPLHYPLYWCINQFGKLSNPQLQRAFYPAQKKAKLWLYSDSKKK